MSLLLVLPHPFSRQVFRAITLTVYAEYTTAEEPLCVVQTKCHADLRPERHV